MYLAWGYVMHLMIASRMLEVLLFVENFQHRNAWRTSGAERSSADIENVYIPAPTS
jgi:hypothetical protein